MFSEEIAEGVRNRDPDAIGAVYVELADRLFGYLMARVHDREAAEDLLEATFVELLEKGYSIRGGSGVIKAWLFRAAHFNALDHLRKRKREREDLHEDTAAIEVEDEAPSPEDHAVRSDLTRRLRQTMEQLSEEQQEVLALRYIAGLTAPEVAAILGKRVSAVRGLQHRGERSLARLMERHSAGVPASSSHPRTSQD